jgi:hypothetical protein
VTTEYKGLYISSAFTLLFLIFKEDNKMEGEYKEYYGKPVKVFYERKRYAFDHSKGEFDLTRPLGKDIICSTGLLELDNEKFIKLRRFPEKNAPKNVLSFTNKRNNGIRVEPETFPDWKFRHGEIVGHID